MRIKVLSIALVATMGLYSCDDSEETPVGDFTAVEAEANLTNLSDELEQDIVEIAQNGGTEALADLSSLLVDQDLFSGRATVENATVKIILHENLRRFKSIFVPKKSVNLGRTEDDEFDFQANWGVYNWVPEAENFEKSSESAEMIIINFPLEGSQTNNTTLRLVEFEEQAFQEEDGTHYSPSRLVADLTVDGVEEVSLDFDVTYNTEEAPLEADIELFVKPFTFTASLKPVSASADVVTLGAQRGETQIINIIGNVEFFNAEKEGVKNLDGSVSYRSYSIAGDIDGAGLESEDVVDPNDYINLILKKDNRKIGDIVLVEELVDGYDEYVPYVQFSDGTQKLLEDVLQPAIDEIEEIVMSLEG